jgi:SNF2 family DNA or RNA helicase
LVVRLEKRGRRIIIDSDEPLTGMKTTIPGAYKSTKGPWTVPLNMESCKLLREKFGRSLRISKELRRWAHGVNESRAQMAELAAASDAELTTLPQVAPKLAAAMGKRTYQRVGVRYVADSHAPLIADDPGLGKTLIAMGGLLEAGIEGPYLVVAPKTAGDSVWKREITRWLPKGHKAVTLPDTRIMRERTIRLSRYGPMTWLIVHPEIVLVQSFWICHLCGKKSIEKARKKALECGHIRDRKTKKLIKPAYPKLFEVEFGAVIVDESHESLIKRTGTPTQRRRGLDMLRTRSDGMRIAMSGTPFDSKPHQLWGTLNWLDSVTYSAFNRWAELYWQKGGHTGYQIGEFRKDREQLLWDSLSTVALRRTKAEVAKDLPPKIYVGSELTPGNPDSPQGIWLEMSGKQKTAYQEMEERSVTELKSGRLEALSGLAELTRLKQLACSYGDIDRVLKRGEVVEKYRPVLPSNKYDWIVEALEEWGYPREALTKVVIVSFYTGILGAFQQGIEKHFKTKANRPLCTAITGLTPSKDRRRIIDEFNASGRYSPQVMMLNVKAGGTAITIDSADKMIFISETRIPDQQNQAEDRIHRVSNPRTCMYYYLRSLETVDVGTALVNQEAQRDTHRLLDGRRGVDYVRHVLDLSHT